MKAELRKRSNAEILKMDKLFENLDYELDIWMLQSFLFANFLFLPSSILFLQRFDKVDLLVRFWLNGEHEGVKILFLLFLFPLFLFVHHLPHFSFGSVEGLVPFDLLVGNFLFEKSNESRDITAGA